MLSIVLIPVWMYKQKHLHSYPQFLSGSVTSKNLGGHMCTQFTHILLCWKEKNELHHKNKWNFTAIGFLLKMLKHTIQHVSNCLIRRLAIELLPAKVF